MGRHVGYLIPCLVLLMGTIACTRQAVEPSHKLALEAWARHEDLLKAFLASSHNPHGPTPVGNDRIAFYRSALDRAVAFFHQATGIAPTADYGSFGYLPSPELAADLTRWKQWYASHEKCLIIDLATAAVVVRQSGPECQQSQSPPHA